MDQQLAQDLRGPARAAYRLAELGCRRMVEPRIGLKLWDLGVGDVVEQMIFESDIPSQPITALEIARALGLVKGRRK